MFAKIKKFIFGDNQKPAMTRRQRDMERYLAASVDLVDLERRQRELTRKGF